MQIFFGKRAFFNHGTAVSHLFVQLATIFSFQISNFAIVFFNFLTSKHFGVCYMFNINYLFLKPRFYRKFLLVYMSVAIIPTFVDCCLDTDTDEKKFQPNSKRKR